MTTPLLRSLQRGLSASLLLLAFSSTGQSAQFTAPAAFNGYVGTDYGFYTLHNNGNSRTDGAWSLGGTYAYPLDSLSTLQVSTDYYRLSQGNGGGGTNAWTGDLHYSYKYEDIPVGGFLGGFSNNGRSTWGGGLETSLPLGKVEVVADCPMMQTSVLNLQAIYARTGDTSTNRWGGRAEVRAYPQENVRVSANFGFQRSTDQVGPFSFPSNVWNLGISGEYLFPNGWSAYGEYEHTHFNRSGLKVEGFTFGLRYCFGRTKKIRETEGLGYANFARQLGVALKF